jgi:SAM-dependent methyltransferase
MKEPDLDNNQLPSEILAYYELGGEAGRLFTGAGQLELARTKELLERYMPPPPATILDVGGGTGIYARWLSAKNYEVHLIDALPEHVESARQLSRSQQPRPIASASVGDARSLNWQNDSVDAVLLLGPLYHLTKQEERLQALSEVRRVLRRGGFVFAIGISRFASTLAGLSRGFLEDPEFALISQQDLRDGQHRNPSNKPGYFTTAYFHLPEELGMEIVQAGLSHERTVAIEGPAWMLSDFDVCWDDPDKRRRLLEALRAIEGAGSLLGASAHLMAIGRKSGA